MGRAIPPLPQYAFMACCSVKAQGKLHLQGYGPVMDSCEHGNETLDSIEGGEFVD
jgi:hypothetical protein